MSSSTQYCTFYVNSHLFGVEVLEVQEVIRGLQVTEVPLALTMIGGLINLRGQIVTVIDLRQRLQLPAQVETIEDPMNVVVHSGDEITSLLVHDIGDVIDVDVDQYEEVPCDLGYAVSSLITGAYKLDGKLMLVLDIDRVVNIAAHT